jgi:septal ring factor EnvC (AmiA/AmiB activator)
MSDDPTRRLPATSPEVRQREVAYVHSDEALWRESVNDRLRSLTTAVTLAVIVAVAALAVALWSVLGDSDDGATSDRVSRLEERVEALDARLQQRPAAVDLAAVRERQQALEQAIRRLQGQIDQPDEDTAAVIEAVDATQQSIAQLEQRVADLEQTAP